MRSNECAVRWNVQGREADYTSPHSSKFSLNKSPLFFGPLNSVRCARVRCRSVHPYPLGLSDVNGILRSRPPQLLPVERAATRVTVPTSFATIVT